MTDMASYAVPESGCQSGFSEQDLATLSTARLILQRKLHRANLISSWSMLTEYLVLSASQERVETFRVLFLNRKTVLIRDKIMGRGTVDHVPVYVREVLRSALLLDACAVILCHNHPSGDPRPSKDDIEMTQKIAEACKLFEITLHDHVIVGHGREDVAFSMKAEGLI